MNVCKKCKSEFQGNYCNNCGHPQKIERINGRYILSEIGSVLNFQKGILYTVKELLIRPGQNIRAYISEDRNRLVKPIMFILITSLIYTVFVRIFHFEDGYVSFIFVIWAIGQFFDKRKIVNYVKALISYLLGMITFTFVSLGIGILIDLIK